jgi:hypothetical protein
MHEKIPVRGILSLYKIPAHWTDEEFRYWWCPVVDQFGHVLQEARISDEAKQQRLVKVPDENMLTNAGITLWLSNNSVSGQGNMYPFSQIFSVGNGTFTGATRTATSVSGDGFASGSRKAPVSNSQVGFQSTIVFNFASGDAVGSWTNAGLYGFNTGNSTNATTSSGTGALMTIAPFVFTKGASAYAVNYVFLLSN